MALEMQVPLLRRNPNSSQKSQRCGRAKPSLDDSAFNSTLSSHSDPSFKYEHFTVTSTWLCLVIDHRTYHHLLAPISPPESCQTILLLFSSHHSTCEDQFAIALESGGHQLSLSSLKTSSGSRHIVGDQPPDVPQDPEVGQSNGHATATTSY